MPPRKARQACRRFLKLLSNSDDTHFQKTLILLRESPEKISSSQASLLINKIGDPLMAYDFYRFMKAQPGFEPRGVLYGALIDTQVKSKNPKPYKIRFYLDEMRKRNLKFSEREYGILFNTFLGIDLELADVCFELMKATGTTLAVESYNFVIGACLSHGLYDKALLIVEEMRIENVSFNEETYCNILRVCKHFGNANEAVRIFREMKGNSINLSLETYNLLLIVVVSAGETKVATAIVEEMRVLGFKPDKGFLENSAKAYLKSNMLDEVDNLLKDESLKDRNGISDLIKIFAGKKILLQEFEALQLMEKSGLDASNLDLSKVIYACARIGMVGEAIKVYDYVKASNRIIDKSIYLAMLCVFCKAEMQHSAEKFFEEMSDHGFVNEGAYLYMMTLYGNLGRLEDVMKTFQSMKENRCNINVDAYSVLIDIMGKAGRMNQARKFLLEMRKSQIQPNNVIYSTLIRSYLSIGRLDCSLMYIEEFRCSGLIPDAITAGTVATVLAQAGKYGQLETLMDDLIRKGIKFPKDKGIFLMDLCTDAVLSDKISRLI
ncbi:hypothetical protein SUGI_0888390 [Cryptomeria japonica]|nr:hypothetical protein SUGI_0888390 [Cryptomeria japonica]